MIRSYFLTALRSLVRNKSYSFLNIVGLALGITCSILLFLVIRYELSFDTFHPKADRIYRITTTVTREDQSKKESSVYFPVSTVLRQNNPGFENLSQVYADENIQISVPAASGNEPKHYLEEGLIGFVEPEYFDVFDFAPDKASFQEGLQEPNTAVLTRSLAAKYFPGEDATGKIIRLNNKINLKVLSVIPDLPANTDMPFFMFVSYASVKNYSTFDLNSWNYSLSYQHVYLTLPAHANVAAFEAAMNRTLKAHMPPNKSEITAFALQPLHDFHYNPDISNFSDQVTPRTTIWAMAVIGIFLVLTACINFVNLATAQAIKRAKEVGVRKVLGSNRSQLMFRFFGETLLITLFATLISVIMVELSLPYLNNLLELHLNFSLLLDPVLLLFLVLEIAAVTFFSGIYPAFVMARFRPIDALKSKIATQQVSGLSFRSTLVVAQFTICQVLIICTLVVTEQMQYLRNKSLGFNREGVVQVILPSQSAKKLMAYRQDILLHPAVKAVSFALAPPSSNFTYGTSFFYERSTEKMPFHSNTKFADENYFDMFNIPFVAGRAYTRNDTATEVVINETMRRKLGLKSPEEALGKKISFDGRSQLPIIGVVEDFHQNSLHAGVDPSIMTTSAENYFFLTAKIDVGQTEAALRHIENTWHKAYPDNVFDYEFLDETIAAFYRDEARQNTLFKVFSCIAILIGCLGLYGLVAFMAAQRTKEVGIRKVMGASVLDITVLFSKEFIKLVIIAFIIAAPVAYYLMQMWLQNFTYKIDINYQVFVLAGTATLLIALLTMSAQAIKAAVANPVLSLKSE
ncbi:ABC transporter permease [Pontibacter sp. SGAir0037]|uniref:ABC transporter permease n=1 Tax=Pontibacter sp. SGAir0037 TaxID=2571030 RepID=UPI0010CD48DB|nr:ABC transporter permease [Pontibacter sp. SGAir0037]QCR22439.1 hypothetical protein C1N53_08880 [Pontibacter sp. SGAir0037]